MVETCCRYVLKRWHTAITITIAVIVVVVVVLVAEVICVIIVIVNVIDFKLMTTCPEGVGGRGGSL